MKTQAASVRPKTSITGKTIGIAIIVVFVIFTAGVIVGWKIIRHSPYENVTADGNIKANPGPWGDLEYTPIIIAPPAELLNPREYEKQTVQWFFKGFSRDKLVRLLDSLGLPRAQRNLLTGPQLLSASINGLVLAPSRDAVMALSASSALQNIYNVLYTCDKNEPYKEHCLLKNIERFEELGVSKETISLLRKLSCKFGNYLVCYNLPYVLSGIPTYKEKTNFLKAFYQQQTMLIKLNVTPQADIDALVAYWGKAFWTTDAKALLESLKRLPTGGQIDVIELLPPLPTSLLYTYPMPPNRLSGPVVDQNCSWTAFNFFRDSADPRYSEANYVVDKLKTDYYPILSDPQYGDIIVILTPDNLLVHTAVYIADDIVFTKNGTNTLSPWIFSRLSNLIEIFSCYVAPSQKLQVLYFRNKSY